MVRVIRWVCDKCDLKWIHPIDKCIYCFGPIKKQIGSKTKVVGNTKVSIPNPLHPIIPYNVIILEDEHGNRMPKKTMKDYNIGDEYIDVANSSDNAFAIVKIKYDMYEAVGEAIDLIGGINVNSSSKVLVKPNLSIPGYPYIGICTNPKVLDGVIQNLIDRGVHPDNITIAEQSFFVPFEKAVDKAELHSIARKHKVKVCDISKTEFSTVHEREFTFEVSNIVKDFDVLINVPVIKTDMMFGIDGAFENLTRFLSKKTVDEFAKDPQKAVLAFSILPKLFPKFITISDASIGMQGNGPAEHGEPGFYNMIFASRNPVVHDKAVQEIFCLREMPYVKLAGQLGLGEADISKIKFVGNEFEAVRRDIKQPIGSKLIKKRG